MTTKNDYEVIEVATTADRFVPMDITPDELNDMLAIDLPNPFREYDGMLATDAKIIEEIASDPRQSAASAVAYLRAVRDDIVARFDGIIEVFDRLPANESVAIASPPANWRVDSGNVDDEILVVAAAMYRDGDRGAISRACRVLSALASLQIAEVPENEWPTYPHWHVGADNEVDFVEMTDEAADQFIADANRTVAERGAA